MLSALSDDLHQPEGRAWANRDSNDDRIHVDIVYTLWLFNIAIEHDYL